MLWGGFLRKEKERRIYQDGLPMANENFITPNVINFSSYLGWELENY